MSHQALLRRLYEELEKMYHACIRLLEYELHDVVEHEHHMMGMPTECDLAAVKIRSRGNELSITYDASVLCIADAEEDVEEVGGGEEECPGEEDLRIAWQTLNEYRKLIAEWAKELGISYSEELKRDGLTFTLTVYITPTAHITSP